MAETSPFQSPAFIVGKERSGTTLLSAIMNRHPEVCVTPETDFMYQLSKYPGGHEKFKEDWPGSLYKIVDRIKPTADWVKPAQSLYDKLDGKAVSGRDAFLALGELISERYKKINWIEKTPNHIHCLPFIREVFPNSPIVHIVRDGRDVAYSLTQVKFGSPNYYNNLWEWMDAVSKVRVFQAIDKLTITIRYEDLVLYPEDTIKKVCDFLALIYYPEMLEPDGSEASLLDTTGSHMKQAARKVDSAKLAAWKSNLSSSLISSAEMIAHKELNDWGYELSTMARSQKGFFDLHLSEYLLISRDKRLLFNKIIEATANPNKGIRFSGTFNFSDPLPSTLPHIIITEEFPYSSAKQINGRGVVSIIVSLIAKLVKLRKAGVMLIWVMNPKANEYSTWRLKTMIENIMIRFCTLIIIDDTSLGESHEMLLRTLKAEKMVIGSSDDLDERLQLTLASLQSPETR
jgi:hypothetical protein